jgi:hypothetical protein
MFTNAQTEWKFLRVYIPARNVGNFKSEHRPEVKGYNREKRKKCINFTNMERH